MKRLLSGLMAILAVLSLFAGCTEQPAPTTTLPPASSTVSVPQTTAPVGYTDTTVILYTANVRGDVSVYSHIAAVKAAYEAEGAAVYLVDAGNYLQGTAYASGDMGLTIYQLMEAAGYDVAGMGIYELVYGEAEVGYAAHGDLVKFYTQAELYRGAKVLTYQQNAPWAKEPVKATRAAKAAAGFRVVCSNLARQADATGYYDFDASAVLGSHLKIGFVSAMPENAADYLGDGFLTGYSYTQVAAPDCDILVSLGAGEGDIVIEAPVDGGMTAGAYVIRHATGEITFEEVELSASDAQLDALIASITAPAVIGTSTVMLNGSAEAACNGMSALGMLVSNALKWYGETKLEGIEYPVIGLFNGGNCRNFLYDGEITETDIRNALHGSQSGVGVVYLTGAQLLEALEAATQRDHCPGWPYAADLRYSVSLNAYYDAGAAYGQYFKANSINRVTILTEGFDPEATYAVVADMLLLKGEDTYYLLRDCEIAVRDASGADVCQILELYIQEALKGRIGE